MLLDRVAAVKFSAGTQGQGSRTAVARSRLRLETTVAPAAVAPLVADGDVLETEIDVSVDVTDAADAASWSDLAISAFQKDCFSLFLSPSALSWLQMFENDGVRSDARVKGLWSLFLML